MLNHIEFDYHKIIAYRRKQFEVDGKAYHLNYEKMIMKVRGRHGEESQSFKLSYALKWEIESGMLLTDKDWARITNRKKGLDNFDEDDEMVMGLDIAKTVNSTVMTIGKVLPPLDEHSPVRKEIVAWIELNNVDYEAQHHLILDAVIAYNIKKLAGDYTGVGKPVLDRLMYACGEYVEIIPYTFSSSTKSDLFYAFVGDISTGRLIVPFNSKVRASPEGAHFEEQMMNCQKYFNGPYLVVEKMDGFNDDYVDSCALMCHAADAQSAESHEVEETENVFYSDTLAVLRKQSQYQ